MGGGLCVDVIRRQVVSFPDIRRRNPGLLVVQRPVISAAHKPQNRGKNHWGDPKADPALKQGNGFHRGGKRVESRRSQGILRRGKSKRVLWPGTLPLAGVRGGGGGRPKREALQFPPAQTETEEDESVSEGLKKKKEEGKRRTSFPSWAVVEFLNSRFPNSFL